MPTKEKNPKHRSAYKKENLNQNYKRIKNEVKFKIEATTKKLNLNQPTKKNPKSESNSITKEKSKAEVRNEATYKRRNPSPKSKRINLQKEEKIQVRSRIESYPKVQAECLRLELN